MELNMMGGHQVVNAASAIGAIDALRSVDIFVSQGSVREGVSSAQWPGRMEVLREDPIVIVDGAQNAASAMALRRAIDSHFGGKKFVLVLGVSMDKDIKGICDALCPDASHIVFTAADNPRAADPNILKGYASNKSVEIAADSRRALEAACSKAEKDDVVVVAGSLFLAGEIRDEIRS